MPDFLSAGLEMTADEGLQRCAEKEGERGKREPWVPPQPRGWQGRRERDGAGPGDVGGEGVRVDEEVMLANASRRLRCKAAKCAIASGIRLVRKGAVAEGLIKAVTAYDRCAGGQSREEQEIVSEAMELWADVHVAVAALSREQVLKVQADIRLIQVRRW